MNDPDPVISHPESQLHAQIPLQEHLFSCGEKTVKKSPTSNQFKTEEMARFIGYFHDIAKATNKFQNYLQDDSIKQSPHNHAPQSSLIGAAVAYKSNIKFNICELGLIFSVINNHHGHTANDLGDLVFKQFFEKTQSLADSTKKVLRDIKQSNNEHILSTMVNAVGVNFRSVSQVVSAVTEFEEFIKTKIREFKSELETKQVYPEYLKLWSSLGLADISHSTRINEKGFEIPTIHRMNTHINQLESIDKSELNQLRESARKSALEKSNETDWEKVDVANLVLPTGLGKTFTGISVATDILSSNDDKNIITDEKQNYTSQTNGRIIYTLPFTSIIDQVYDVMEGVLDVSCIHSDRLSKDHYLENSTSNESYEFLRNSWSQGMTVTTFVQLFESLLAPKRSQSTKIPHLHNSIIILDEPQAIPRDWWALINKLIEFLTEQYNVTVISMTATPPRIFDLSEKVLDNSLNQIDLIESPKLLFEKEVIERVNYKIDKSIDPANKSISHQKLADKILNTNSQHILSICNTIDSTNTLFNEIIEQTQNPILANEYLNEQNFEEKVLGKANAKRTTVINLTSRHRPADRRKLIALINKFPSNKKLIVTSTQILEAGVDISFDEIFRDIAPLNNISQTAGRCNRNSENKIGVVHILQLENSEDPDKKSPSKAVYSRKTDVISATQKILSTQLTDTDSTMIQQSTIDYNLVQEYYTKLKDEFKITGDLKYIKYFNSGKLNKLSSLSMIEEGMNQQTIYVFDNKKQANEIRDKFNKFNYEKATELLESYKDYQVSISAWSESDKSKLEQLNTVDPHKSISDTYTVIMSPFYSLKYGLEIPDSTSQSRLI